MSTTPKPSIADFTARLRKLPQFGNDLAEALERLGKSIDSSSGTTASTGGGAMFEVVFSSVVYPPVASSPIVIVLTADISIGVPIGPGTILEIFLVQDSVGGHAVTWSSDYVGINLDLISDAGTYGKYSFNRRSDNKWVLSQIINSGSLWQG